MPKAIIDFMKQAEERTRKRVPAPMRVQALRELSQREIDRVNAGLERFKGRLKPPRLTFMFPLSTERKWLLDYMRGRSMPKDVALKLMNSRDFVIRTCMLRTWMKNMPFEVVEKALMDKDPAVRMNAWKAAPAFKEKMLPKLKRAINDERGEVRIAAIEAAPKIGKSSMSLLLDEYEHQDPWIKAAIIKSLAKYGEPSRPHITAALKTGEHDIALAAVDAAMELDGEELSRGNITPLTDKVWGMLTAPLSKGVHEGKSEWFYAEEALERLPKFKDAKKETLSIIAGMVKHPYARTGSKAVEALQYMGEDAIPLLHQALRDPKIMVRSSAASAAAAFGESGIPLLMDALEDREDVVREAAVHPFSRIGKVGWKIVRLALKDGSYTVRKKAVTMLPSFAKAYEEDVIRLLNVGMSDNEAVIRKEALKAVSLLGQDVISRHRDELTTNITRMVKEDKEKFVRATAGETLFGVLSQEGEVERLFTQKPLFATPFIEELGDRLWRLQGIRDTLQREFGSDFVGIIINGSTAKGYMAPRSDLDFAVVADKRRHEITERFMELAKDMNLCIEEINRQRDRETKPAEIQKERLFYGIFLGDHTRLREMQKDILKGISEEEWDGIRAQIMSKENTNVLEKGVMERFGKIKGMNRIESIIALLRTPPTYTEMCQRLGIVKER